MTKRSSTRATSSPQACNATSRSSRRSTNATGVRAVRLRRFGEPGNPRTRSRRSQRQSRYDLQVGIASDPSAQHDEGRVEAARVWKDRPRVLHVLRLLVVGGAEDEPVTAPGESARRDAYAPGAEPDGHGAAVECGMERARIDAGACVGDADPDGGARPDATREQA